MTGMGTALRKVRPITTNLVLVLISVGVTLLIIEFAVRTIMPQQLIQIRPDIWQPDSTVGYTHRPNVATHINNGEGEVDFFTDQDGFRVGARGRVESPSRVLVIGDSYMEALGVRYEESFPGRLETRLREATGETVAVRNAGVGGWGPNHYLIRARALLARDSYNLMVVAVYVGNDVMRRRVDAIAPRKPVQRASFRFPRRLSWAEFTNALLAPVNDKLEVRSHLYTLLKRRLETLRMRLGLAALYLPREFYRSEASAPDWALTGEICNDLAQAAAAHGVPTVFVMIPAAYQVDPRTFERYVVGFGIDTSAVDLDQPNRLLDDALRSHGLFVVDELERFRAVHAAGTRLYGVTDSHLNSAGHELLVETSLPAILGILASESPESAPSGG